MISCAMRTARTAHNYEVLCSSGLKEWQVLDIVNMETPTQVFVDKSAGEQSMRLNQVELVEQPSGEELKAEGKPQ